MRPPRDPTFCVSLKWVPVPVSQGLPQLVSCPGCHLGLLAPLLIVALLRSQASHDCGPRSSCCSCHWPGCNQKLLPRCRHCLSCCSVIIAVTLAAQILPLLAEPFTWCLAPLGRSGDAPQVRAQSGPQRQTPFKKIGEP